jgi:hypothetical protein
MFILFGKAIISCRFHLTRRPSSIPTRPDRVVKLGLDVRQNRLELCHSDAIGRDDRIGGMEIPITGLPCGLFEGWTVILMPPSILLKGITICAFCHLALQGDRHS